MKKENIKKILVISLTNIGDVVLTFPAIDILLQEFPRAEISIVVGPRAESLVAKNPIFKKVHIFNKKDSFLKQGAWVWSLFLERFDLLVDLRNTALPVLLSPKNHTSIFKTKSDGMHMKDKHLKCLNTVFSFDLLAKEKKSLFISDHDKSAVMDIMYEDIGENDFVVVAPSSASEDKRWSNEGFAAVSDYLIKTHNKKIVFVGDGKDREVAREIIKLMEYSSVNLCGKTNLVQLAELMVHCQFALVNDSAPMHIASYMDVPVLALFGPTPIEKYGPWSSHSFSIRKNYNCYKCNNPKSKNHHDCMMNINKEDVINCLLENFLT